MPIPPRLAPFSREEQIARVLAGGNACEKSLPFLRQKCVAGFARFGSRNVDRSIGRIEISSSHRSKFTVAGL